MYLRLDAGFSASMEALVHDQNTANPVVCADQACSSAGTIPGSAGGSGVLGLGVGLRASENWRWDITGTYRGGFDIQGADGRGTQFQTNVKSWSLMLSGYYDIDSGSDWRPYVGGGIGPARNKVEQMTAVVNGAPVEFPGGQDTSTGFHVTFGGSTRLNNGLVIDLAFRYVDLGDLRSDAGPGNSGLVGRLKTRELLATLRF